LTESLQSFRATTMTRSTRSVTFAIVSLAFHTRIASSAFPIR
jgi:hypothetical protein